MHAPPRTWTTERLSLRPPAQGDAATLVERFTRDLDVTRFLTWTAYDSIARAQAFIDRSDGGWKDESIFTWSIWVRESAEFAGMITLRPRGPAVELGYALAAEHWRCGFMSEVLRALIPSLLADDSIWRVWAVCDVENAASAGLLQHLGMQREGVLRRWTTHPNVSAEPRDCLCFSIVKTSAERHYPPPP